MNFILNYLHKSGHHRQQIRSIFDSAASIKWVRDRALDHAVEKERNLKPMLNLKNFIKSEPSKSLPLSLIVQKKHSLEIPIRPIEFIRKYPTVFEEFLPAGIGIGVDPHVKLTTQVLDLDVEEQLVYNTEEHKQEVAGRLLKLLMVGKINKIPLRIIDKLKWDLGLPQDYAQSIVPEFPDYFQVSNYNDLSFLELVCWSSELAVSVMEKKAMSKGNDYRKGMPIAFPLQYSRGFEVDKKFKKWVDDWQKLPYISPYENALSSQPKSEESDKWAVGVLHEVLSLFVPKKTEKDNVLLLGDYLGVRSRFKRALLQHPGIFYISSKLHTHTVVLRESYKRDLLIGKYNPVMGMRSKYIHLMNMVKEENQSKSSQGGKTRKEKNTQESKEGNVEEFENDESEEAKDANSNQMLDSEFEDESDDDYEDEDEEDDDDEEESTMSRGRTSRREEFEDKTIPLKTESNQFDGRLQNRTMDKRSADFSRRKEFSRRNERGEAVSRHPSNTPDKQSLLYSRGKQSPVRNERDQSNRRHGKTLDKQSPTFSRGKQSPVRNERDESHTRYPNKNWDKRSPTFSRRESHLRNENDESHNRYPSKSPDKQSPTYARRRESHFKNENDESHERYPSKTLDKHSQTFSRRRESHMRDEPSRPARVHQGGTQDKQSSTSCRGKEVQRRNDSNRSDRPYPSKTHDKQSGAYSRGKEISEYRNVRKRPHEMSDDSRSRKNRTPTS